MTAETLESMDEELRASRVRTKNWVISRRDETSLLTSLGTVTYSKTLFKNKDTGACEYLLDRIMGIESHVRMTEDAEAQMLEEAVDSSYRKGGLRTSISDTVSKQTVKNKIHKLKFHPKVDHKRAKWMAEETFEKILNATQQESQMRKVMASRTYILGQWSGIIEG